MKHLNPLLLLFAGLALVCLCNADVLQLAQERSLFMQGSLFWHDCLRNVGGLLQWAGCYLTQLFYYPWLGGTILILLWVAAYYLLRRLTSLPHDWQWLTLIPCFALMASVIDLGYWIYYLKQPGYFGRETLGLLSVLLLLQWPTSRTSATIAQRFGWLTSVVAVGCYPLLGWYAVLALILLALCALLRRQWLNAGIALLLVVFGPALFARQYTTLRLTDAWTAGFPLIANFTTIAWSSLLPFAVLIISLVGLLLSPLYASRLRASRLLPILGPALLIAITAYSNVWNHNYHAEIRMLHALQEFRYNAVLQEMDEAPEGPTRQMVCMKNLALLHTGHLSDKMFRYENAGPAPAVTDSLALHMVQTCATQLYLYHGMTNDATHWAIENGVEQGFSVDHLHTLALAALINGESQLARKYLDMLSWVPFQSRFVQRYYGLAIHPEWISDYPELKLMHELHNDVPDVVNRDDGNCEFRIYRLWANYLGYTSPRAKELALVYALMLKDYDFIWPQFFEYAHSMTGSQMPLYFQEAVYLGCHIDPQGHSLADFHFDSTLKQRYEAMRTVKPKQNNHSYWWFFSYCKNVTTY